MKFLENISNSNDRKQIFKLLKILFFVVLFGLVIFAVKSTNKSPKDQDAGTFKITKQDDTLKTKWFKTAADDFKTQQDSLKRIEKELRDLKVENKTLSDKLKKQENVQSGDEDSKTDQNGLFKNFPKPDGKTREELNKYVPQGVKSLENLMSGDKKGNAEKKSPEAILHKTPIVEKQIYQNSLGVENIAPRRSDSSKKEQSILDILPTGSILHATLVNGMDAPTMSQAKDNPLVVHMIVKDLAILPNKFKYDIRECFVLGEGYGDLASERVYIRTNDLSCITEDGEHIDYELKGYVAGEDGKIGLRGTVVSKQGAFLARAIVGGFVDGVGKAFSQVGNTVQVTPYGTTTTNTDISSSELAKKGIYSGLSSGASKLADFYLKLADQVFPVIEISARRDVDIVVTKKRDMTPLEQQPSSEDDANAKKQTAQKTHEKDQPTVQSQTINNINNFKR